MSTPLPSYALAEGARQPRDELLRIRDLCTDITTAAGTTRAVDEVSFAVERGEAVGLVGESGCGKSMTGRSVMRLLPPGGRIVAGQVVLGGRDLVSLEEAAMREIRGVEAAMVFQDPMSYLNPIMRIGDQVREMIRKPREQAQAEAIALLERVHIPRAREVARSYPHQLSGGMQQRVLIATAIAARPALLIADEPTTALDVTVQAQILDLLDELRREFHLALLLITHDLALVAERCERVLVMYAGRLIEEAPTTALFDSPQHPYTETLLQAVRSIDVSSWEQITGQPPSLLDPPPGCRFHPRCRLAFDRCAAEEPGLFAVGSSRSARCWLREDAGDDGPSPKGQAAGGSGGEGSAR